MKKIKWTTARIAKLKRLWGDGLSATSCASAFGKDEKTHQPLFTRNAIIGKVHRLELPGREKPDAVKRSIPRKTRPSVSKLASQRWTGGAAVVKPIGHNEAFEPIAGGLVPLVALTDNTCRWPVGDPKAAGFGFCGAACDREHTYCEGHASIACNVNNGFKTGHYSWAEKNYIAKHWAGGTNIPAIAKTLNRSPGSVKKLAVEVLGLRMAGKAVA